MTERRQRRRRGLSSTGKIGKYALREPIRIQPGRALYKSYDPFLDRDVAIKIIQLFDPSGDENTEASDAFFAEAQAIGRLQHQNIVSVYDAGVGDYEGYIVMEYIHGNSLFKLMDNPLSLSESLRIVSGVCHALHYAHEKNIIHRDIKPSNVMISSDGQIKVVDFGISILRKGDDDIPGLMGSPSYMAPELVHGQVPNELSDLFSVAVVLYELISGKLPFVGTDAHAVLYKIINGEPDPIDADIPSPLRDLISKGLSKDPVDRYQSAPELERELNNLREMLNTTPTVFSDINTVKLKQMNIFQQCEIEVLHEISNCLELKMIEVGEYFIRESEEYLYEDFLYIVEGNAILVAGEKHHVLNEGQWVVEKTLRKGLGIFGCKALTITHILRVSKSDLLMCSAETQAYFFQYMMEKFYLQS